MGEMITFKRPDGKECSGYLAIPAEGDKAPGVVVIQEWWGINDQIKGVADKLVGLGYRALVPDLYKGKVTLDAAEAKHLMTKVNFESYWYDAAHAFGNETGPNYNAAAAKLAWDRTIAFLAKYLK